MKYELIEKPVLQTAECLVVGVFTDEPIADLASLIAVSPTLLEHLANRLKELGDSVWQTELEGHSLLLVHCGQKADFNTGVLNKVLQEIIANVLKQRFLSLTICLPLVQDQTADWQLKRMLLQFETQLYQLVDFKTKTSNPCQLELMKFYLPSAKAATLEHTQAVVSGVNFSRRLADLPANYCTPSYLGEQALELAKIDSKLTVNVLGLKEIKKLGMGALLAVSQGSQEEPRFIEMHYRNGGTSAPVVLVGKGITFDSGGLSLKPGNAMDEMKYDMCGAASVMGTIKTCALLNLPLNIIGLVASAENMPDGNALKPGDIIKSMSGQTIEVLNTDAEGRLILADALTFAERFNPAFVLDIATLTGAIVVALGYHTTGFMTADEELAKAIFKAAQISGDRSWRLPLEEVYQDALDSPLADMINASFDRSAGAITAACFLSRFSKNYRWAHLDIAGSAWVSGKKRHATGRPVPLLVQLLCDYASDAR